MSEAPIDEGTWTAGAILAGLPAPGSPGSLQIYEAGGLEAGSEYHFALKVSDESGNAAAVSNDAAGATLAPGTYLFDPSLSDAFGSPSTVFEYQVTYLDYESDEPVARDVYIDGVPHAMTQVSGDLFEGAVFRFATRLSSSLQEYSYYFRFDDGAGHVVQTDPVDGPLVGDIFFTMGSPLDEPGRDPLEGRETPHRVLLADSVLASPREVTQSEWNALMQDDFGNPSHFQGADLPVESVTFYEAAEYCNRLSVLDGLTPAYTITPVGPGAQVSWNRDADGWRLPTEAEWEWLCRAGTESAFSSGGISALGCNSDANLDAVGWYCGNSSNTTQPAGSKAASNFGLYDMHGNVMEWCWDWYSLYPEGLVLDEGGPASGEYRVMRGGSWFHQAKECRSAARSATPEDSRHDYLGFRAVRSLN
jgi:formylglycine-generating enzyme required for sulfatase activity